MNILGLTSGSQRPGQAGTTGQLFFNKCGDPPKGCECKFEPPKGNQRNYLQSLTKAKLFFLTYFTIDNNVLWLKNFSQQTDFANWIE